MSPYKIIPEIEYYEVLEYIEADGTNSIYIDYVPINNYNEIETSFIKLDKYDYLNSMYIVDNTNYANVQYIYRVSGNNYGSIFLTCGTKNINVSDINNKPATYTKRDYKFINDTTTMSIYADGKLVGSGTTTFNIALSEQYNAQYMYMFKNPNSSLGASKVRLFSFVYSNGDAKSDSSIKIKFLPVIKSNGDIGLYDTVNNIFKKQIIGNDFIAGPKTGEIIYP